MTAYEILDIKIQKIKEIFNVGRGDKNWCLIDLGVRQ